jgi:hypothetical protein
MTPDRASTDGQRAGGYSAVPASPGPAKGLLSPRARVVAFYLPQFHQTPENDAWWGTGFTEWTNVARAKRLFPGHTQPRLPSELGFYDLRVPEVRALQAELAASAGIEAFAYWHYWFGGKRLLHRPIDEVLASRSPSLSFFLAWANRDWKGIWHGADGRTLIKQTYPTGDLERHTELMAQFMADPRYFRVSDRPVLYILEPLSLPGGGAYVEKLRHLAIRNGFSNPYVIGEYEDVFGARGARDLPGIATLGLDAVCYIRFPIRHRSYRIATRLLHTAGFPKIYTYCRRPVLPPDGPSLPDVPIVPTVLPNWDNTPRAHRRGVVVVRGSPSLFRKHLRAAVNFVQRYPPHERLVFIKSWNEWAEGNYLEPDREFGSGYLAAIETEMRDWQSKGARASVAT